MLTATNWFIIIVITIVTRVLPRVIVPRAVGSDTYYHLIRADNIRSLRFKLPIEQPQFVLFGPDYYPPLYHYLLALFPRKQRHYAELLTGAVFDCLLVVLFLMTAGTFFMNTWSATSLALLALIFALNPALTSLSYGPRAYSGTARIVGEFLVSLSLVAMMFYSTTGNGIWFLCAVFGASLTMLTSAFGTQALVFLSILIGIFIGSYEIVILPIVAAFVAIVMSQGFYWKSLKRHVTHLINYKSSISKIHPAIIKRVGMRVKQNIYENLKYYLYHNKFTVFFFRNEIIIILLLLTGYNYYSGLGVSSGKYLSAWFFGALITFLLTSTRYLSFLGEAERYLEYAVIPVLLLLGMQLNGFAESFRNAIMFGILIIYCLPFYISQVIAFLIWAKNLPIGAEYENFVEALNKSTKGIALCILNDAPWRLAYQTHHQFIWRSLQRKYDSPEDAIERFYSVYPWPHADLERYAKRYGVTLVPVARDVLSRMAKAGIVYDFSKYNIVFENTKYVLYQYAGNITC